MTSDIKSLFPQDGSVLLYPDDFQDEKGNIVKDLIFPDVVSRKTGHFADKRKVVFFRPSAMPYKDINFPVGYWTQVLGLGETPDQVTFTGTRGIYCLPANTDNPDVGSLDTFWRSAENFRSETSFLDAKTNLKTDKAWIPVVHGETPVDVTKSLTPPYNYNDNGVDLPSKHGMLWAVSQAAPLRRIDVANDLYLSLGSNNASGGFMSNVKIGRNLMFGSQQQFCARNCDVGVEAQNGAWSMVLMGCNSSNQQEEGRVNWPAGSAKPAVISQALNDTIQTIEKPFLFLDDKNVLQLGVPKMKRGNNGSTHDKMLPNERFPVDNKDTVKVFTSYSSFDAIQQAAKDGIHIVLSPGIYKWGKSLIIDVDDQVVLGIGMATIEAPGDGSPCIHVRSKTKGVRLSGIALEASVISKFIYKGSCLLQWGDKDMIGQDTGKEFVANPGAIHDLYCFVGGRSLERTVKVECMVKIYSSHVIGDNLWLWRADHSQLMPKEEPNRPALSEYHVTTYGECRCDTGLEVYGDYVTFYGLAVEHTYKDMVSWYGKNGSVYFYQSEMPYDVPGDAYKDIGGYCVHVGADNHIAKGVGIYSYFRDYDNVVADSAVLHHAMDGNYENVFTVWLNGYSGIKHIINGNGSATLTPGTPYFIPSYKGENNLWSPHFWKGLWKKLVTQTN